MKPVVDHPYRSSGDVKGNKSCTRFGKSLSNSTVTHSDLQHVLILDVLEGYMEKEIRIESKIPVVEFFQRGERIIDYAKGFRELRAAELVPKCSIAIANFSLS